MGQYGLRDPWDTIGHIGPLARRNGLCLENEYEITDSVITDYRTYTDLTREMSKVHVAFRSRLLCCCSAAPAVSSKNGYIHLKRTLHLP